MNKRIEYRVEEKDRIMITIEELQARLSCGRATAVEIAEDCGAVIRYGRLVRYNVEIIKKYIMEISS